MLQRTLESVFCKSEDRAFLEKQGYSLSKEIGQLNPVTGSIVLHDAVIHEKEEMVRILIEEKANLDEYNQSTDCTWQGRTSLHLAVFVRNVSITQLLLTHKADVNKPDSVGLSPLMLAAHKGEKEIADILLKAGADINQESHAKVKSEYAEYFRGKTPLMHAAAVNKKEMMCFLIEQGARLRNTQGKIFLTYCTKPKVKKEMEEYIGSKTTETCKSNNSHSQIFTSTSSSSTSVKILKTIDSHSPQASTAQKNKEYASSATSKTSNNFETESLAIQDQSKNSYSSKSVSNQNIYLKKDVTPKNSHAPENQRPTYAEVVKRGL